MKKIILLLGITVLFIGAAVIPSTAKITHSENLGQTTTDDNDVYIFNNAFILGNGNMITQNGRTIILATKMIVIGIGKNLEEEKDPQLRLLFLGEGDSIDTLFIVPPRNGEHSIARATFSTLVRDEL